jgi:putative transcriptional regulator
MEFNFDAYRPHNILEPKRGRLLISEPLSQDLFFTRSIVLLTEYSEEGSFGFVLNKLSEYNLSKLFEEDFTFNPIVNYGGPVGTETVHFLHTMGDIIENSRQITDNLFWGGNFDIVKDMAKLGALNDKEIRFFIGYSGWAPKQLEDELKQNLWLISESNNDIIFNTRSKDDWKNILTKLDDRYKLWANVPENPSFN